MPPPFYCKELYQPNKRKRKKRKGKEKHEKEKKNEGHKDIGLAIGKASEKGLTITEYLAHKLHPKIKHYFQTKLNKMLANNGQ